MRKDFSCPTQKVRFRDHKEAIGALHRSVTIREFAAQDGFSTRRKETRSYHCKKCKGFHLTSKQQWGLAA
jgi:hypothetical protein